MNSSSPPTDDTAPEEPAPRPAFVLNRLRFADPLRWLVKGWRDFIQVHYGGWYFPAFNLADSAITLGAICLILDEILRVRRAR